MNLQELCEIISNFMNENPKKLTKLNLVIVSNVCPDLSNIEEFKREGANRIPKTQTTKLFLITNDR